MADAPRPDRLRQRRGTTLRTYFVAVMLLATLPLAGLMCWRILMDVRGQQDQIEDQLARSAASLAQAVENELVGSMEALSVLAQTSAWQQPGPLQLQLRQPRRDWDGVFLVDGDGRPLFDTTGAAAGGQATAMPELLRLLAGLQQPAVLSLAPAGADRGPPVIVAVPLARQDDGSRQVLGARIGAVAWQRLAGTASRPEGGHAVLFDAQQRAVAQTAGAGAAAVRLPAETAEAARSRPFGVHRTLDADARAVYAAWQAVPAAGWTVLVGAPAAPIDAAHRRAILAAFGLSGACLAAGVLLATLAARRVTRPLHELAVHGPVAAEVPTSVREVALLQHALRQAAQRDESARARLQAVAQELRENQRMMDLAQEAGHVGFFHYRFADAQLAWTPGQCRLFGLPPGAPVTCLADWWERIDAADRERVERAFWTACAQRREAVALDYGIRDADGQARWLSSRIALAHDADGRALQAWGVTVDMTEQREAQRRREQDAQRAEAGRREAEAASRAKDEFLRMFSHELRNPLGAIAAAADVLEAAPHGDTSAQEARAIISRQARHLAHMMAQLLDVGRALAGQVRLARQPVDLAALARRVEQTFVLTHAAGRHPLRLQLAPAWALGDVARLEQVLSQLVANAVRYTPAGSPIDIATGMQAGMAELQVRDAGAGIPAELLPHVFELFTQGDRPLDRSAGGLGLGLTLVHRLVELHGGSVAVDSSGQGTCFTVRLPAAVAPPHIEDDALPPSRRRHVLVVEDNADVRAALRSRLELDGHRVSTASDGVDGLERVLQLRPEVSIVDIGLPGMTGYELARHARAAGYAGRMIALSGYGRDSDADSAYVAGFDAYLVKPVDRRRLRACLQED